MINLKKILRHSSRPWLYRIRKNVNRSTSKKRCLLCYIIDPIRKKNNASHTNHLEFNLILQVLGKNGFSIDVCQFDYEYAWIDFGEYDLIFGLGINIENALKSRVSAKIITYATGAPFIDNAVQIADRVRSATEKTDFRYPKFNLLLQNLIPSGIFCLGGEERKMDFKKWTDSPVGSAFLPGYHILDGKEFILNRLNNKRKNGFLWFGSTGATHKGLDLLLDAFSLRKDLILHICGSGLDQDTISRLKTNDEANIIYHGYVSLTSTSFRNICNECSFTILPSCSEAMSGALVNTVLNGGMLPISSKYVGYPVEGGGLCIESLTVQSVIDAIDLAGNLDANELAERSTTSIDFARSNFTEEQYSRKLQSFIEIVL